MAKDSEKNFRKALQLQDDVMDLMANMMINGDPFLQERAFTKEEKKVEKTAEKRHQTNQGGNHVDSDQSPLKGIEAQVRKYLLLSYQPIEFWVSLFCLHDRLSSLPSLTVFQTYAFEMLT